MFLHNGSLWALIFASSSVISASLFRASFSHRFVIDLGMDFGIIFDVCLIPFAFAHATCKNFEYFAYQEIMIFIIFVGTCFDLDFDDFGYRVRFHLEPFWYYFHVFSRSLF